MHFATEQERIPLNCFHLYLIVWSATLLVRWKLSNHREHVFFVAEVAKIRLVPGSHVLYVVEREIFTTKAIQRVCNVKVPENQAMVCHVHVVEAKE